MKNRKYKSPWDSRVQWQRKYPSQIGVTPEPINDHSKKNNTNRNNDNPIESEQPSFKFRYKQKK